MKNKELKKQLLELEYLQFNFTKDGMYVVTGNGEKLTFIEYINILDYILDMISKKYYGDEYEKIKEVMKIW